MLPPTATRIKVTNLLTPYVIRICEEIRYNQRLDYVNKQLLSKRNIFRGAGKRAAAKIGDAVIARGKLDEAVDSPGWLCRGYISGIDPLEDAYTIFLVDYGVCMVSPRENFALCAGDEVSERHLSRTVGLYNVLPASVHPTDDTLTVSREWSASAIEYARQLMRASDTIYFDDLAMDPSGPCYGEFYLNVQDNVIRLSHALVLNDHAIYLQPDVVKFVKDPAIREDASNDEISYRFSVSNAFDRGNEERREDSERFAQVSARILFDSRPLRVRTFDLSLPQLRETREAEEGDSELQRAGEEQREGVDLREGENCAGGFHFGCQVPRASTQSVEGLGEMVGAEEDTIVHLAGYEEQFGRGSYWGGKEWQNCRIRVRYLRTSRCQLQPPAGNKSIGVDTVLVLVRGVASRFFVRGISAELSNDKIGRRDLRPKCLTDARY